MPTAHEQLSEQFRKWEIRGRGWQVFDEPVHPEPPFVPFHGHFLPEAPLIDDGRRPTFLSSLYRKLTSQPEAPPVIPEPEEDPEPTPLIRDSLVEFQTLLPDNLDIARESFEQFLSNLSLCREPLAFELLGTHKKVAAQFIAATSDAPLLRRQLSAYFPEAVFVPKENVLEQAFDESRGDEILAVEFGLAHEFMLPLASGKIDPFIGIIGALSELHPGELGLFQVLLQSVEHSWDENIVNSVTHADGKPFFVNAPELAGAAENKVSKPLYAAVVRILITFCDALTLQPLFMAGGMHQLMEKRGVIGVLIVEAFAFGHLNGVLGWRICGMRHTVLYDWLLGHFRHDLRRWRHGK